MKDLKNKFISGLVEENAFFVRKEPFNLHSGGHSHIFVNPMSYMIKPKNLKFLTEILAQIIKSLGLTDYKLAAGPSVGGYALTTALALKLNKEFLCTTETEHEALKTYVHGNMKKDDNIILIDDVVTTGKTFIEIAEWFRKIGARVNHAIVPVISHLSCLKYMKENGIECHYFVSVREMMDALWDRFSEEEKKLIEDEIKEVPID